jgi:hypothetical protein
VAALPDLCWLFDEQTKFVNDALEKENEALDVENDRLEQHAQLLEELSARVADSGRTESISRTRTRTHAHAHARTHATSTTSPQACANI